MDTIPEASGLAASARNAGVLYIVNDNPGTREVWAVRTDGSLIGAKETAPRRTRL
ncbi:MAG: hypothetical protein H0V05_02425 [Euzebyaceae bacterium]|nr:hypothetical protein [Euzebyaceae bacterium]